MQSGASTVEQYLAELPVDKRETVDTLRGIVLANLPEGYVEAMNWGMISYEVPLELSGKTYNGQPLMYAAIGAQKNHVGLYLCGLYCDTSLRDSFEEAYSAAGRRFDMGKSCLRIRKQDHIVPDAIAAAIAATPIAAFIASSRRDAK